VQAEADDRSMVCGCGSEVYDSNLMPSVKILRSVLLRCQRRQFERTGYAVHSPPTAISFTQFLIPIIRDLLADRVQKVATKFLSK
jgi:hypothetical protein